MRLQLAGVTGAPQHGPVARVVLLWARCLWADIGPVLCRRPSVRPRQIGECCRSQEARPPPAEAGSLDETGGSVYTPR